MPAPIATQLYSLREEAAKDLSAVIRRLGEVGFRGVETADLHGHTPAEVRRMVGDAGMEVCCAHVQPPKGDAANAILDQAEALGVSRVVVAFLPPEHFADADSVARVAERLNESSANARGRGLALGYHNHFWEYGTRIDGRPAMEVLFDQLEPEVFAEVDVYWAQVGGADPAAAVAALGERVRLLHMKDGPADAPESAMTAAGGGAVDLRAVAAAAPGAEWHIVELDRCDTDMFEAVAESHRWLTGEGVSEGRA